MKAFTSSLLPIAFLASTSLYAQSSTATPPEWENPHVYGVNKEPAHATFTPFPDGSTSLHEGTSSPWVQSLNGSWKFHWVKQPDQRPVDFFKPDFDVSSKKKKPEPTNKKKKSYGTPIYTNITY